MNQKTSNSQSSAITSTVVDCDAMNRKSHDAAMRRDSAQTNNIKRKWEELPKEIKETLTMLLLNTLKNKRFFYDWNGDLNERWGKAIHIRNLTKQRITNENKKPKGK